MSVPDVAPWISIRSLAPGVITASPSGVVVRWLLRATTVIIFAAATVLGVQVALTAPTEPPAAVAEFRP